MHIVASSLGGTKLVFLLGVLGMVARFLQAFDLPPDRPKPSHSSVPVRSLNCSCHRPACRTLNKECIFVCLGDGKNYLVALPDCDAYSAVSAIGVSCNYCARQRSVVATASC